MITELSSGKSRIDKYNYTFRVEQKACIFECDITIIFKDLKFQDFFISNMPTKSFGLDQILLFTWVKERITTLEGELCINKTES